MSRRRKTKASKAGKERLEPEDVLSGHVTFRPEDLFDLIHQVNPTRKGLSPKEESRRYALKSRLQSRLILRYGDDYLDVSRAEREGVVNLDHRSGLRDACHAVLAELEPEARAWVLRQLDLAASGGEDDGLGERLAALDEDDADGVGDLLQRGRRAVEEYDYELGEDLLRQAFEESRRPPVGAGQGVAAALALLELQVDLLGLDAAALEIEGRLTAAAKEQPAIRTLLALAAARLGDAEGARRQLAGLTPAVAGFSLTRAAQVYAALTSQAIADHDRATARRYLGQVAEYDSTHPEISRLEGEIARLHAADQRAVEAELERRFRELGAAAVEDEARDLADRWPAGEVARRILRQAAAERREAEIEEHLELAEKARAEERFAAAAEHFSAALAAGCERPDLPALATEATDRARHQEEGEAVDQAARRLVATDGKGADGRRDALLGYLALAAELRARVRAALTQPALEWLDDLDAPPSGSQAKAAAVAVAALERALVALAGDEAQAAVDTMEPHRAVLGPLEPARNLWRDAHGRLTQERRRRALQTLETAWEALEERGADAARSLLRDVDRDDLEDEDFARVDELSTRIADADRLARLRHRHEERLAAGDVPVALTVAVELARREASAEDRRRWQKRAAELQARVRSDWRIETVAGERPIEEAVQPSHWLEGAAVWLDDEGKELVLATAWERWIFIDVMDVARHRIVERVSLRTPRPFDRPLHTRREGDRLWIAGQHGEIVVLARDGWDVLAYHPVSELVAEDHDAERLYPLSGGRWVWLRSVGPWGGDQVCVADLEAWRLAHRLPFHSVVLTPVRSDAKSRMLVSDRKFATRVYTAGGEPAGSQRLGKGVVMGAGPGLDGRGLLLLVAEDKDEDPPEDASVERRLALVRLVESPHAGDLQVASRLELPGAHSYGGFDTVVTSPDRGLGFVFYRTRDDDKELLVLSEVAGSPALTPLTRSRWHAQTWLMRDRSGRHVATMDFSREDMELRFLGAEEPEPFPAPRSKRGDSPAYTVYSGSCDRATGAFQAAVEELSTELEGEGVGPLRTRLGRLEGSESATVDDQIRLALALQQRKRDHHGKLDDAIFGFARRMAKKHPKHPGVCLLLADLEALKENWGEVRRLLRRPKTKGLHAGRARHFHHLAGLAALHAGRLGESYKAFRRGMEHEGKCAIEPLLHLTQPMSDPPKAEEWAAGEPKMRRLVAAIRTADHALARGDAATARAALERGDVRWQHELQIAARRADVYLESPAQNAAERFGERSALAFYLQLRQTEKWMRHELFLPGLQWEEERLAEIETRARKRLEEV